MKLLKRKVQMVWLIDEQRPERPPFDVPIGTYKTLQRQREKSKIAGDYKIVDDPGIPKIFVSPKGNYEMTEAPVKTSLKEKEVIEETEETAEKIVKKPAKKSPAKKKRIIKKN